MIEWELQRENFVRGSCSRGVVWIRLSREEKATGIYFMFNSVEKLVPKTEREETLAGAKQWAEDQLQLMDWAEELENKLK